MCLCDQALLLERPLQETLQLAPCDNPQQSQRETARPRTPGLKVNSFPFTFSEISFPNFSLNVHHYWLPSLYLFTITNQPPTFPFFSYSQPNFFKTCSTQGRLSG